MGLANFLDKAALGAAQILSGYNRSEFEAALLQTEIGIVFGSNAISTHEGRAALDMLIRLLARLFPSLSLVNQTQDNQFQNELEALAKSINPEVNLSTRRSNIYVMVGEVELQFNDTPTFFIGASEWIAKFSTSKIQTFDNSNNPFGAGAVACFAAANVFRLVFKDQLPHGKLDTDFSFSVFDLVKNPGKMVNIGLKNVNINQIHLFGAGAIGNGFIWALKNILGLKGQLHICDDQTIELSNLQRYVLASQQDVGHLKVDCSASQLNDSGLEIVKHPFKLQNLFSQAKNYNIEVAAICVDSAEDRMALQSTLPKKIFNAWTQLESIGISRHSDFLNSACVCCLYLPEEKKQSRSEEVASNLGIQAHERIVRDYLASGKTVDQFLLNLVQSSNNLPDQSLAHLEGLSLDNFYSHVVCGGVLMNLSPDQNIPSKIEVPCAFESALAGILLASEVVIDSGNLRSKNITSSSRLNLLRPLSDYLNIQHIKHLSGKCICQDEIFLSVYFKKWDVSSSLYVNSESGDLSQKGKQRAQIFSGHNPKREDVNDSKLSQKEKN